MTVATFISRVRREVKDSGIPTRYKFTGDGSSTLFRVREAPILAGSYTITNGGSAQTEGTHYTIDLETGVISFASAPSAGNEIIIDYKYVKLSDASFLDIIVQGMDDMEGPYWTEATEELADDSDTTSLAYDVPTNTIDVVNFWYKTVDSSNVDWEMVAEIINWRFSPDDEQIFLGKPFYSANMPLRVHVLKGFTRPTATTDTLDMPDSYLNVLQAFCIMKFWEYRLAEVAQTQTKAATESTLISTRQMQDLVRHFERTYQETFNSYKPTKPARRLAAFANTGGTP